MGGDFIDLRFLPYLLTYVAISLFLFSLGTLLFHLYSTQEQLVPYNELAGGRFDFMEPMLAVVVLFAIAVTWIRYNDLQSVISNESSRLTILGRSALSLTEPERTKLTSAVADYSASLADEWVILGKTGNASYATADELQRLTTAYAGAQAQNGRERWLLYYSNRIVRELVEQRENRLVAGEYPLGDALRTTIIFALAATLMLTWFFGLANLATKLIIGSLFTSTVILLLMFNDIMMQAFEGPAALDYSAYMELARDLRADLALSAP